MFVYVHAHILDRQLGGAGPKDASPIRCNYDSQTSHSNGRGSQSAQVYSPLKYCARTWNHNSHYCGDLKHNVAVDIYLKPKKRLHYVNLILFGGQPRSSLSLAIVC